MSKFCLFVLIAASLGTTAASAQTSFHFGVRAGGNLARETQTTAGPRFVNYATDEKVGPRLAEQVGVVAEARFGRLAFQPALLFSQKGSRNTVTFSSSSPGFTPYDYYSSQNITRTNWLEMPLNFVYTPAVDHGFQVFAGPYVGLGLGGQQISAGYLTSSSGAARQDFSTERPLSFGENGTYRRFDFGFNAGLGYRRGPLQLQAGYGYGLRNLRNPFPVGGSSYNRVAQLTATYFWGK